MAELSTYERVKRMYEHREADRVPITDSPWGATLERWHREGMPADADFSEFFGLDRFAHIGVDNSPRYPVQVVEEREEYVITTSPWGVTMKNWKHRGGVPEFLDFTIVDWDSWLRAKERMTPSPDRIPWDHLKENYRRWREEDYWISAGLWFGFDVTHSWVVGTERVLLAMVEQPEWLTDMFRHFLDVNLALLDMVCEAGYTFDEITWPDDMGYKQHQFFSLKTYRELLKPFHRRACEWAQARGVHVRLHSCGDVRPFIPDLIEIGVQMLNPIEVKAGMDPVALKQQYGAQLGFHGGLNAVLFYDMDAMFAEMERVIPVMKQGGGYIISSDHSVPDSVSLVQFRQFVRKAKELGRYD